MRKLKIYRSMLLLFLLGLYFPLDRTIGMIIAVSLLIATYFELDECRYTQMKKRLRNGNF